MILSHDAKVIGLISKWIILYVAWIQIERSAAGGRSHFVAEDNVESRDADCKAGSMVILQLQQQQQSMFTTVIIACSFIDRAAYIDRIYCVQSLKSSVSSAHSWSVRRISQPLKHGQLTCTPWVKKPRQLYCCPYLRQILTNSLNSFTNLVSRTCMCMWLLQLCCLSSGYASRLISSPIPIPIPYLVQYLRSDTCHFGHFNRSCYLLTYLLQHSAGVCNRNPSKDFTTPQTHSIH